MPGDKLTTWNIENDSSEVPPISGVHASGAADPMAISLAPFERQFRDFGEAIRLGRTPLVTGEQGYRALEVVVVSRGPNDFTRLLIHLRAPASVQRCVPGRVF
jgi:hypothetical protein